MAFINHSQLTISYVSGNHCKIINICLLVLFIFISNYQKRFCPPIYSSFLTLLERKRTITTISFQILVGYGYDLEESPDWYKLEWENSK